MGSGLVGELVDEDEEVLEGDVAPEAVGGSDDEAATGGGGHSFGGPARPDAAFLSRICPFL